MAEPFGILIFGPNGSGKTTVGREVARTLGFLHMDHEAYHFAESEVPYTVERPRAECLRLMLADMEAHGSFVLSAVMGDFGPEIERHYRLAVWLCAPVDARMARIEVRELERHGARVLPGGDLHAQHRTFVDFARERPLERIAQWAAGLSCPVMRVDATEDVGAIVTRVAGRVLAWNG